MRARDEQAVYEQGERYRMSVCPVYALCSDYVCLLIWRHELYERMRAAYDAGYMTRSLRYSKINIILIKFRYPEHIDYRL